MACIVKKIRKGRAYYYAVQSARVDGKPRIIWQKYLGTLDHIVKRASGQLEYQLKEAIIFEAGGIAAMLRIADTIQLVKIIDDLIPITGRGPSVGQYILLAAINRIIDPCSKSQIPEWYQNTILLRLWKYPPEKFNSQRFWDCMDLISEETINIIQEKVITYVKNTYKINPHVLLYDTTNFFTYIATNNQRNTIAQRGRQKQKRNDLRQVGLALLVSKDFQIPLFHRSYQGNLVDQGLFPKISAEIIESYNKVFNEPGETTLVYDKGNISEDGQEQLIIEGQHFVCAVPKYTFPELFETPIDKLQPVENMPGTKALSSELKIWNTKLRAVLTYTDGFFSSQMVDLMQTIQKCEKKLNDLDKKYSKWKKGQRIKRPTLQEAKKASDKLIAEGCMKDIFKIDVIMKGDHPRISYNIDQVKLDYLIKHTLGRTLIITSRFEWSENEVILSYRGLNNIESAFKRMKNKDYLHWYPAFHWTDQKIKVHSLYCVIALLLATLAHRKVVEKIIDISLIEMIDELNKIREVAVIYSEGPKNKKNEITISKMSTRQKKIAEILEIGLYLISSVGNTKNVLQQTDV